MNNRNFTFLLVASRGLVFNCSYAGKCLPSGGDDESDLFVSDDGQTSDADSLKSIKDSTSISSLIADLDVSNYGWCMHLGRHRIILSVLG